MFCYKYVQYALKKASNMRITASKLRDDIYNILDRVIKTGIPVEVVRKGSILSIAPKKEEARRASRKRWRPAMLWDPEKYVHIDWLDEWNGMKK